MNKILENCLNELLARERNNTIYFPNNDNIWLRDVPDSNYRKNPKLRYIQAVSLSNGIIHVIVVTPTSDGRTKHMISEYKFSKFDDKTKGLILQKACRYHE